MKRKEGSFSSALLFTDSCFPFSSFFKYTQNSRKERSRCPNHRTACTQTDRRTSSTWLPWQRARLKRRESRNAGRRSRRSRRILDSLPKREEDDEQKEEGKREERERERGDLFGLFGLRMSDSQIGPGRANCLASGLSSRVLSVCLSLFGPLGWPSPPLASYQTVVTDTQRHFQLCARPASRPGPDDGTHVRSNTFPNHLSRQGRIREARENK